MMDSNVKDLTEIYNSAYGLQVSKISFLPHFSASMAI